MNSLAQFVIQQSQAAWNVVRYESNIARCFARVPVVTFFRFTEKSQAGNSQPGTLRKLRPDPHREAAPSGAPQLLTEG